MLLMFLFQHNLYAVFREQQDRCFPTCGAGASLPFKSSIVNRWKVCKQMTGAITMWNWLGSQLLKAHCLHYSFNAALWWQNTWIAHQDYNTFVFSISCHKGTSPTAVEATEREWAGAIFIGKGLTMIQAPQVISHFLIFLKPTKSKRGPETKGLPWSQRGRSWERVRRKSSWGHIQIKLGTEAWAGAESVHQPFLVIEDWLTVSASIHTCNMYILGPFSQFILRVLSLLRR